ncbi:putative methyltransferase DDB_G0268948 [Bradysia coprophila]|uniref:putative methyltransferase DDB_G0268948 n=1 Tax=Bradysia coprophila TaxID=38358 RepID=UPI00187DAA61|nr:putative methyltransferase DDB_G0268948 [Bradysia coprophila]
MSRLFEAAVIAASYAKFRPQPPATVIAHVIKYVKEGLLTEHPIDLSLAVDIGCGSGQCTNFLAPHFTTVHGFDTSANQIKHAKENNSFANVLYDVADGHSLPVMDNSVDLVTCCQSFHWLDTNIFYPELNRILKRNGVVALITYEMPFVVLNATHKTGEQDMTRQLIRSFYGHSKIKSYWAAKERCLVDTAYKTVVLPFPNQMRIDDTLISEGVSASSIVGYINSWSAFQSLKDKNAKEADEFIDEFKKVSTDMCGGDLDADCFSLEYPFHLVMARKK